MSTPTVVLESRGNNGEREQFEVLDGLTRRGFVQQCLIHWPEGVTLLQIHAAHQIYDEIEKSMEGKE